MRTCVCVCAGGSFFNLFNLGAKPEELKKLKLNEIKNGRLAMIAMLGYGAQATLTRVGPFQNLTDHLADPVNNNILVSTHARVCEGQGRAGHTGAGRARPWQWPIPACLLGRLLGRKHGVSAGRAGLQGPSCMPRRLWTPGADTCACLPVLVHALQTNFSKVYGQL